MYILGSVHAAGAIKPVQSTAAKPTKVSREIQRGYVLINMSLNAYRIVAEYIE